MIARMVDILSSMIKPAVPNINTIDMIVGNAKNWGYTTLIILQNHYKDGLDTLLTDLPKQITPNWREAFVVATRWARRSLARVTQDVLDHAEALIMSCVEAGDTGDANRGDLDAVQGEPAGRQVRGRGAVLPESQARFLEEIVPYSSETGSTSGRLEAPARRETGATSVTAGKGQRPVADLGTAAAEGGGLLDSHGGPPPTRATSSVATMTDQRTESPNEWSVAAALDRESQLPGQCSPQVQRIHRRSPRPAVRTAEGTAHQSGGGGGWETHLLEGDELVDLDLTPTLTPEVQSHAPIVHAAQVHREGRLLSDELFEDLDGPFSHDPVGDHTSTPRLSMYKPFRHMNTDHKLLDWTLNVTRKWLIIGDSNVARLPMHSFPDLQIDGYPGANFRHAEAILAKLARNEMVEKVVLAFGLNSRAQKAKETAVKQMQAAVRVAKSTFPFAEIWVPLVNFSSSLPPEEIDTLQKLNAHVARNMPFIELLPDADFQTERDNIHWTQTTARAMFDHWSSFLNFNAPEAC
ncbi:hypothetical protein Q5P01_001029 [Channa striata]|uniref:Uncharacterized protein n=1 Tax=Channa striata TaxID=64152 RepID=A0AA88T2F9_CHASR|nr:hypothetical protein Q5P01_001029 [Channa striata]